MSEIKKLLAELKVSLGEEPEGQEGFDDALAKLTLDYGSKQADAFADAVLALTNDVAARLKVSLSDLSRAQVDDLLRKVRHYAHELVSVTGFPDDIRPKNEASSIDKEGLIPQAEWDAMSAEERKAASKEAAGVPFDELPADVQADFKKHGMRALGRRKN